MDSKKPLKMRKVFRGKKCEIRFFKKSSELGTNSFIVLSKDTDKFYFAKIIKCDIEDRDNYDQMIDQEIFNLITFQHPSIIKFVNYSDEDFDDKGNTTIFYEYLSKGSLSDLLEREQNTIDNTNRQIILCGIAGAIRFIHSKNYVHLNLTPKNILIDDNYNPHLSIFGLLKSTKNAQKSDFQYESSIYTAPEIFETGQITEKTNVYSFGLIMFQVLTGLSPNLLHDDKERSLNILRQKSTRYLYQLCLECISPNPEKRPNFDDIFNNIGYDIKYFYYDADFKENDSFYLNNIDLNDFTTYLSKTFDENDDNNVNNNNDDKKIIIDLNKKIKQMNEKINFYSQQLHDLNNQVQILQSNSESSRKSSTNNDDYSTEQYNHSNEPSSNNNNNDDDDDYSNQHENDSNANNDDNNYSADNDNENSSFIQSHNINDSVFNDNLHEEQFIIKYETLNTVWKRKVEIIDSYNNLFFTCESIKDKNFGKMHIICTKSPANFDLDSFVGALIHYQKGDRFTLLNKTDNFNLKKHQLAGIAFYYEQKEAKYRKMNLAIPADGQPFISDEEDLSQIALKGNHHENIMLFTSLIPNKNEKSKKNFRICNENGSIIFTIDKKSKDTCKVKFTQPLTPLIAYSISVAVATSHF